MSEYCEHSGVKLDIKDHDCKHQVMVICAPCARSVCAEREKLLEFVKSIANHTNFQETEQEFMKFYVKKEAEAEELLKELGEL